MFDATCRRCASVVLLGPRRVVSLENTADGIVLAYRCYCGEVGTELLGRATRRRTPGADSERRRPSGTEDGRTLSQTPGRPSPPT